MNAPRMNWKTLGTLGGVASVAILVLLGASLAPAQTLTGHWAFDGDLLDQVGSNHATIPSGDSTVGTDNGVIGGAVTFDGDGDVVQLPSAILGDGPFTLSFWEYTDVGGHVDGGYLFSGDPAAEFFTRRYKGAYNGKIRRNTVAGGAPSIQEWHHSMITYDDDGDIAWYVDGMFGGQSAPDDQYKKPFAANAGNYYLGNSVAVNRPLAGLIDDLQVYTGVGTANQALYLATNPGATLDTYVPVEPPEPVGLLGHWKFDGNLDDALGNYHGSAIGDAAAGTGDGAFAGSGAVFFDGDNDAVSISADALANETGAMSLAFWSKTHADGSDGYLMCDSGNYHNLLIRRFNDEETEQSIFTSQFSNTYFAGFGPDGTHDTSWPLDTWHHHAFSHKTEGETNWYVDGQLMETVDTGGGFFGLVDDLFLGNRAEGDRALKGWLDDLQVYDMELSAAQAQWLHDNPGSVVPEPGALAMLLALFVLGFSRRGRNT